jgi:galactokinase
VTKEKRLDAGQLEERFKESFSGRSPDGIALAPGRVNLIGEHTDYNDGFVFPMAIDRHIAVAFAVRDDRQVRVGAQAFNQVREFDLQGLEPPMDGWLSYIAGVAWALASRGDVIRGLDLVVDGDVPIGAGLSSSAALELATARAFAAAFGIAWVPAEMARLGQKAENDFVGVNCGLMDQLASAVCEKGSALLLDCRSLETKAIPLPENAAVVVMDTGARRSLVESAYNERRASCERAVAALRQHDPTIRALRDVQEEQLGRARESMDETTFRRASHVVAENRRPTEMSQAFLSGDLHAAGALMNASHASLRDLYEVSSPELDRITEIAREHSACHGARLTGAGFGGCAIALVSKPDAESFSEAVQTRYRDSFDLPSALFVCHPSAGAHLLGT